MNQIKPVFDKKISQLCHSKEFRVFSYLVIILILITGELYGFFVGTLKVLEGELLLGVTAFLLMSTTTIYFAFINYNLMK